MKFIKEILKKIKNSKSVILISVLLLGIISGLLSGYIFRGNTLESTASVDNTGDLSYKKHKEHTVWTCSMHPQIKMDKPGKCPICGMDLIPLKDGSNESSQDSLTTVGLSERAKMLSKLKTARVVRQKSFNDVSLLGRVETAETGIKNITAWTGGRIDKLYLNETGEQVKRGQVIASIYSPEIFSAHQNMIAAKQQVEKMQNSTASSLGAAERALEASENRLRLLGVPEQKIRSLLKENSPAKQIKIRSQFKGTILKRLATEGAYIQTGAVLYEIADLSTLWIQLDAYESDLSNLDVGSEVSITVDGINDKTFEGKISFIDPVVDAVKRISKVRVSVDNSDSLLKPGMFAQATVSGSSDRKAPLVIPKTAPLFTGQRSVVYVENPDSDSLEYKIRVVRLGMLTGDVYPVISGLSEGENVVTEGAFVLDADLQIKGGNSMMMQSDDRTVLQGDEGINIPDSVRLEIKTVFEDYLLVKKALAADSLKKAVSGATSIVKDANSVNIKTPPKAVELWKKLRTHIKMHSDMIKESKDIEAARMNFEPLGRVIITLLKRFGNPLKRKLYYSFCPMAMGSKGAHWIQDEDKILNPFYGESMLDCGKIEKVVAPSSYLIIDKVSDTDQSNDGQ